MTPKKHAENAVRSVQQRNRERRWRREKGAEQCKSTPNTLGKGKHTWLR